MRMAPRQTKLDMADMSAGGPVNLVSPTPITNKIPRPTASRSTHKKSPKKSRSGFLAAESFHYAYNGSGKDPKVRRRTPKNGVESSSEANMPRLCAPMHVKEFMELNTTASACVSKSVTTSKEYAERYGPTAKQHVTQCVAVTADGMNEAALRTGDLYRQTCNTDDRGDDQMFFMNVQQQQNDYDQLRNANSMIESSSSSSNNSQDEGAGGFDDHKRKPKNRSDAQPFRSPRFPDAINVLKDPAQEIEVAISPPPRLDRLDTSQWNEMFHNPQPTQNDQSHQDLRATRLELFRQGQKPDFSEAEVRLSRALDDINRQDRAIVRLTSELEDSKAALESTQKKLEESQDSAKKRQLAATEVRARSVQDRKKIEDLFDKEVQQNRKLEGKLAKLQVEAAGLKRALRNARADSAKKSNNNTRHLADNISKARQDQNNRNRQSPPGTKFQPDNSAQVIALRAEVVELKSQLAEARAEKLSDEYSVQSASIAEVENLRRQLRSAESKLEEYEGNALELRKLEGRHGQTEKLLRDKLQRLESSFKETKSNAEERVKEAIADGESARAELLKAKADIHRLERERNSHRLKSGAEVDKMLKQLTKTREETHKLKQQLLDEQNESRDELVKLGNELVEYKLKLSQANQDELLKSTEHIKVQRKLQKDIARQNQEMKGLQEKNTEQEDRIVDLEIQLKAALKQTGGTTAAASRKQAQLENELKLSRSRETRLRQDIEDKMNKSEATRDALETDFREREAKLSAEIDLLKKKVAEFERPTLTSEEAVQTEYSASEQNHEVKFSKKDAPNEGIELLNMDATAFSNPTMTLMVSKQKEVAPTEQSQELEDADKEAENAYLQAEIDLLKKQLADSEASRAVNEEPPDLVQKAKEQAYLNEICVLKACLADAETQYREEKFRAVEERRISRDLEAQRAEEIELLRHQRQKTADAERTLQYTLASMRHQISSPERYVSDPVSPPRDEHKNEKVDEEEEMNKLRQELALAKARLATSGSPRSAMTSQKRPGSPESSVGSTGSSWAPPIMQKDEEKSQTSPTRVDVAELQRKLRESSKRLSDANTKLKGLVKTSDNIMEEHVRMRSNCTSILTLVRNSSSREEPCDGVVDEVMTSASGSIEVEERRYIDV